MAWTEFTITTASIADGAGRVATAVACSSTDRRLHWRVELKTGTSPDDGSQILIYGYRDSGTIITDVETLTDAGVSVQPPNAELIGSITVTSTSDTVVTGEGVWDDPGMTGNFSIVFWNDTGATLSATEGDGTLEYEVETT